MPCTHRLIREFSVGTNRVGETIVSFERPGNLGLQFTAGPLGNEVLVGSIAPLTQAAQLTQLVPGLVLKSIYHSLTMRVELIGHFKSCTTDVYLHIVARMAD